MITIIISRQLCYGFIESPVVLGCQFTDFRLEITESFFLRNTADGSIFWIKTDIAQVIEHRKEGNLCKLGDTCDKDKLLVFIICLKNGKHFSIDICARLMLRSLPGMLQWRIVFINKNRHLLSCLLAGCLDDGIKTVGKLGCRFRSNTILLLQSIKSKI